MDTDGYSDGKTCEFSSTALSLALGVQRLAWSLGLKPSFKEGRSKLYGKDCGPKYRVTFATNQSNPCFTTPRKLGKLQKKSGPTVFARFVTGVRSVGRVEMKCIQVEGGQYLVGEGLIPTHNSFFFGRYVPAFCSTVSPTETLMYISYAASLAEEFTGSSRDTIDEHPELGATLDPGTKSTKEFKIYRYGGGMIARGLGGIPTGRGGHLLMDDLFQDGSDAMRETQRDYAWTQYTSALQTRVELECWTILNGTRWHEDDMHGRFMEREPDEWFITNLPAISFDEVNEDGVSVDPETGIPDALGRGPGEAICPELYPVSYYAGKQKLDPFWYEAEYLGKPSGISGNMFKGEHFKHYKKHVVTGDDGSQEINYELFTGGSTSEFVSEKDCVRFGIVDLAASDKQSADYTVMGVFDMDPWKRLFVREIVRERVTGDNHEDFLKENYVKYGLRVLGIEEASFGFTLIQTLIADPEQSMRIWPLTADKNKKVRAIPAAGLFKKGLIFIDRDADWRSKYESELKKFDRDSHDDQVDVTAYATRMRSILSAAPLPAPEAHKKTGFEGFLSRLADEDEPAEPNETVVICGG
jgi:predicted phage terminase large subunit-like protein